MTKQIVTPFVGVWIETRLRIVLRLCRGVTPFVGVWIETTLIIKQNEKTPVTPFVGVWIETSFRRLNFPCSPSHTLRGCVDWNSNSESDTAPIWGHTLRGCVDWNEYVNYGDDNDMPSHPSWVCGLKQQNVAGQPSCSKVTPFVGVWIETTSTLWYTLIVKSHPSWVCGMKQKTDFIFWAHLKKSFLRKRAIDCQ